MSRQRRHFHRLSFVSGSVDKHRSIRVRWKLYRCRSNRVSPWKWARGKKDTRRWALGTWWTPKTIEFFTLSNVYESLRRDKTTLSGDTVGFWTIRLEPCYTSPCARNLENDKTTVRHFGPRSKLRWKHGFSSQKNGQFALFKTVFYKVEIYPYDLQPTRGMFMFFFFFRTVLAARRTRHLWNALKVNG